MCFHWKLMTQLQEDGITTGYIAKGLWAAEVSSPTPLEDSQTCLRFGRHCQLQPGAAEDNQAEECQAGADQKRLAQVS